MIKQMMLNDVAVIIPKHPAILNHIESELQTKDTIIQNKENIIPKVTDDFQYDINTDKPYDVVVSITPDLLKDLHEYAIKKYNNKMASNNIITNVIMDICRSTKQHHTTSLSFDSKEPRYDVLLRLEDISKSLQSMTNSNFSRHTIENVIKTHVGKDTRTVKKYMDCIKSFVQITPDETGIGRCWKINGFFEAVQDKLMSI